MATMSTSRMTVSLVTIINILAFYSSTVAADLVIFNGSPKHVYAGCFTETDGLNDTHYRTLRGTNEIKANEMTPQMCLDFCDTYKFAGLEWSRECWCGNEINSRSTKQTESDCNNPCDGNKTYACGGDLRLNIYNNTVTSSATSTFTTPSMTPTPTRIPGQDKPNAAAMTVTVIWAVLFARGMALSLGVL